MSEQLIWQPCPFCGGVNVQVIEGSTFRWQVAECAECGARGPEVRVQTTGDGNPMEWDAKGRRDANKAWNERNELCGVPAEAHDVQPLSTEQELKVARDNGYKGQGCSAETLLSTGWGCSASLFDVRRDARDLGYKISDMVKEYCLKYGLTLDQVELTNSLAGVAVRVKV